MKIKCRNCGKTWICLKDTCSVRENSKHICELCVYCFAKIEDITMERAKEKNPSCYPQDTFNPSRR